MDVLQLQYRLLELGYVEVGQADGIFGSQTDAAVRHFQQDNNLVVDGIVGPVTWAALFAQPSQEELKQEWRLAIHSVEILFGSCRAAFVTNFKLERNEIDVRVAKEQVGLVSYYASLAVNGLVDWRNPSERVLPVKVRLERDMEALIRLLGRMEREEIGSPEITEGLLKACDAFERAQTEIVFAALDAGLTQKSLGELESEISDIIQLLLGIESSGG